MIPSSVWSNPFRTQFLCVPTITPNQPNLEFHIRDRGTCAEGENYMQVVKQSDGITLILPVTETPLTSEQQEDWERYRKYFGGSKAE